MTNSSSYNNDRNKNDNNKLTMTSRTIVVEKRHRDMDGPLRCYLLQYEEHLKKWTVPNMSQKLKQSTFKGKLISQISNVMSWSKAVLEKLAVTQLVKKFPFMKSQDPTTGPYPEPD
jgi:hypothetical protein